MNEVARELHRKKNLILTEWEIRIRERVSAARNESHSALRNSLPEFIDDLVFALNDGFMEAKKEMIHFAHHHGCERALYSHYTIEDALNEYNLLRKILFEFLERKVSVPARERNIILEGFYIGMAKAAAEYGRVQNKSLRESYTRLKQVTDTQPALIAHLDRNLRYQLVNKSYEAWFGIPQDKIIGMTVEELIGPEAWKIAYPIYQEVLKGKRVAFEEMIPYTTGTRFVHLQYVPEFDDNNEVTSIFVSVQDMTEQKKNLEDLRVSEERYRSLFTNMTEEVHVWKIGFDENHDVTSWFLIDANTPALKFRKKTLAEMIGKTPDEIFGPRARERLLPAVMKVIREKKPFSFEGFMENSKRWLRFTLFVVGDVLYTTGADITEVKRAENFLRESEAQYKQLANSIPQLAWTTDPEGKMEFANARFVEFTGETVEDIKEDMGFHLIHPDDVPTVSKIWPDQLKKGIEIEMDLRLKNKNGIYHWFLVRVVPLKDENGKILKWFGTNTDVTEQKAMLDALHEETILRDKFVSTLSHDLRTPLTAAKISAELIRRKQPDNPIASLSMRIVDNLDRANKLIEDLLDANKIRAGKGIIPELCDSDAAEIALRTLEDLSTIHGDRFILSAPEKIEAYLDPSGFRRIIENLCTNAIKYGAPNEPVKVTLNVDTDRLVLSVHNKGHPLLNVDTKKLFEPFQRGDGTGKNQGWGIGLTIVKGITEAHKGEVTIATSPEGTTFTISLPLNVRQVREEMQRTH